MGHEAARRAGALACGDERAQAEARAPQAPEDGHALASGLADALVARHEGALDVRERRAIERGGVRRHRRRLVALQVHLCVENLTDAGGHGVQRVLRRHGSRKYAVARRVVETVRAECQTEQRDEVCVDLRGPRRAAVRGREKREVADVAAQVGDDAVRRAVPLEDSPRDHGLGTAPAAVVPQAGRNDAEVPAVHGLDAQRRGNPEAHVARLAIHADAP